MNPSRSFVFGPLLVLLAISCSFGEDADSRRIVSLTPLGTRALIALDLASYVVAADMMSRQLLSGVAAEGALENVAIHRPDLVLVDTPRAQDVESIETLRSSGVPVVEVAPHQLGDALLLYEEIATLLGDTQRGRVVSHRIGDPFARASVSQLGRARPRVAVLVDLERMVLAGGHSFESDLVQISGAESLTHGIDEPRVATSVEELTAMAPDLLILATSTPVGVVEQARTVASLPSLRVAFVTLDLDELWLGESGDVIETWAGLIDSVRNQER